MSIWAINPKISQRANEFSLVRVATAEKQVVNGYCYNVHCDVKSPTGKLAWNIQVFYEGTAERIWKSTLTVGCVPHAYPVCIINENGEPESSIYEPPDVEEATVDDEWVELEMNDETEENKPVRVNDLVVREIAEKTVNWMSTGIDDEAPSTLIRIKSATKRSVTGCVYKLSLDLNGPDGVERCNVVAMDQLWASTKTIALYEWIPLRPWSRSEKILVTEDADSLLLGEFHSAEVNDTAVQDMALFVVSFLNDLEQ